MDADTGGKGMRNIGAMVAGILITATGFWSFAAPSSFYDNIASARS